MKPCLNIKGLALVICLTVFLFSCGKAGPQVVGNPAPEFTLNLLDGGQLGLTELRGKPLMLYFFASW
ncbi:MAG: redoxin domain-containing protein [Proteobacteria bacterium]|nr:redoxin domain-containing protein [Pseudomonadota bacterium]